MRVIGRRGSNRSSPDGFGRDARNNRPEACATQGHGQDFRFEPSAFAHIAKLRAHVGLDAVADEFAFTFGEQPLQVRQHALERTADGVLAARAPEIKIHLGLARAVQQDLFEIVRQVFPGRFQADVEMRGNGAEHGLVINVHPLARPTPRLHRAVLERLFRVGYDQAFVENHLLAEAVADRAGARRGVEGKMFRRGRIVAFARGRAAHLVRVQCLGPFSGVEGRGSRVESRTRFRALDSRLSTLDRRLVQREHHALTPAQRGFNRIAQPHADFVINHQPVHDRLDGVKFLFVELDARVGGEFDEFAVHPGAHEPLAREAFDYVAELAFLPADDGREQHHAGLGRQREDFVHDIAGGLGDDGHAGVRAMRFADVGVQQAEVIVYFRGGGDDRARAGAGTALFDGDGRRQALDEIHLRLLHLVEELPGVGGEAFDVFALALGIDGVESERRFAAPAQAGDDHQLVARDVQREVLEIMLTRAADTDEFLAHGREFSIQTNREI